MTSPNDEDLERLLERIELPDEQLEAVRAYLEEHEFTDTVMERVHRREEESQRVLAWALFALINLALLIILGTNRYILSSYFALQEALSQVFFLFLGISFLGGLFGLIIVVDTSWIEDLPESLQPLLSPIRQLGRYVHRR